MNPYISLYYNKKIDFYHLNVFSDSYISQLMTLVVYGMERDASGLGVQPSCPTETNSTSKWTNIFSFNFVNITLTTVTHTCTARATHAILYTYIVSIMCKLYMYIIIYTLLWLVFVGPSMVLFCLYMLLAWQFLYWHSFVVVTLDLPPVFSHVFQSSHTHTHTHTHLPIQ